MPEGHLPNLLSMKHEELTCLDRQNGFYRLPRVFFLDPVYFYFQLDINLCGCPWIGNDRGYSARDQILVLRPFLFMFQPQIDGHVGIRRNDLIEVCAIEKVPCISIRCRSNFVAERGVPSV